MRVVKTTIHNFGSYKHLEFDFQNRDLTLIQGPTGSGKSTLCDIIPWCLYGATAKNGSVNDVIAWNSSEPTEGRIVVDLSNSMVEIYRSRNPNDLYFYEYPEGRDTSPIRGKDLQDTQRLINKAIGIDLDLYLTGAYFHEFSHLAGFFTAPARARRELCEQLVDLTFAENLQSRRSTTSKELKLKINSKQKDLQILTGNIEIYENEYEINLKKSLSWKIGQKQKIKNLSSKEQFFEKEKQSTIQSLTERFEKFEKSRRSEIEEAQNLSPEICSKCGNAQLYDEKHKAEIINKVNNLRIEINPFKDLLDKVYNQTNNYTEQIQLVKEESNPYTSKTDLKRINELKLKQDDLQKEAQDLEQNYLDSIELQNLIAVFRSSLVQRTIAEVEAGTNDLISTYFDAEIRVNFTLTEEDKLEVVLWKNGNECNYAQLSKGQRQLLKLSFGLSVMQTVSRHHGIRFNAIFLDEALDGLDDSFKTKAYNLLLAIRRSYESVFVVEHSEALKNLFENKITVQLVNGHSVISE